MPSGRYPWLMPDSDLSSRVAFLLERIARLLASGARADGLNPAQREALRYLARANRFSRNPTAVAQFLAATKGTVSQTLIALERKGLLEKHRDEADGRGVRLELTGAGRGLAAGADRAAGLAGAIASLPPLHVSIISQTLARILADMLDTAGGRSFGNCLGCRHFSDGAHTEGADGPHLCGYFHAPLSEAEAARICAAHEAE